MCILIWTECIYLMYSFCWASRHLHFLKDQESISLIETPLVCPACSNEIMVGVLLAQGVGIQLGSIIQLVSCESSVQRNLASLASGLFPLVPLSKNPADHERHVQNSNALRAFGGSYRNNLSGQSDNVQLLTLWTQSNSPMLSVDFGFSEQTIHP